LEGHGAKDFMSFVSNPSCIHVTCLSSSWVGFAEELDQTQPLHSTPLHGRRNAENAESQNKYTLIGQVLTSLKAISLQIGKENNNLKKEAGGKQMPMYSSVITMENTKCG